MLSIIASGQLLAKHDIVNHQQERGGPLSICCTLGNTFVYCSATSNGTKAPSLFGTSHFGNQSERRAANLHNEFPSLKEIQNWLNHIITNFSPTGLKKTARKTIRARGLTRN